MWDVDVTRWRKSVTVTLPGGSCVEVGSVVVVTDVQWQKSTYSDSSGAECVEVASIFRASQLWRKSTVSTGTDGACVEVADLAAVAVAVRDSKDPDGPKLIFAPSAWQAFATQVKNGTLDLT